MENRRGGRGCCLRRRAFLRQGAIVWQDEPNFTGRIAYRTVFPAALLNGYEIDDCTKWWGPDRHIVIYTSSRIAASLLRHQPAGAGVCGRVMVGHGRREGVAKSFDGFHPQVRHVLDACPSVHKWALVDRNPSRIEPGNITLLATRAIRYTLHGAGRAMAIEDAAVLSRCPEGRQSRRRRRRVPRFEATRKPRTSRVQLSSRTNTWLKERTDPDWSMATTPGTSLSLHTKPRNLRFQLLTGENGVSLMSDRPRGEKIRTRVANATRRPGRCLCRALPQRGG